MQLLGPYNTKLQAFYYEELLQLYQRALAQGDFAGDQTFNESTVTTLVQQSKDFASMPLASAGQRVTDDSVDTPIDILTARFGALTLESDDFESKAAGLISVVEKDTALLDQLLAGANLQTWVSQQPRLKSATQFSWDYGMGNGPASLQVDQSDPSNSVIYPTRCPTNTYLDVPNGAESTGLVAPSIDKTTLAKSLLWSWTKMTDGEKSEDLYGDGWAQLSLLEDRPLLNFLPNPTVQVLLPTGGLVNGVFSVSGTVVGGSLPIFIRTLFIPRRSQVVLTPQNAVPGGSFEAGTTGWLTGSGWTLTTGSGAHKGTSYESKSSQPSWSSGSTYSIGDTVSYLGSEYRSLTNSNNNNLPNANGSTNWAPGGELFSSSFPLKPLDNIYIEAWVKSLSANGTFHIALSCRDHNDVEISPRVKVPGLTSASDYVLVSEILQAINDPAVTSGRLVFTVTGQDVGTWSLDDVRVHLPQNLSPYVVNQDEINIYTPKPNAPTQPLAVFFENEDFISDDVSNITFMGLDDSTSYTIRFTENYPAYQCSVNETIWSPIIMLDPNRPYPDTEKNFDPIKIDLDGLGHRTLFPITDETGVPTGLTLQMISRPLFEYYLQITTPALPQYGATAILEIDFSSTTFLNGLKLSPFSTYPIRIVQVETEAFTADTRQVVGAPNALIDRPTILTFPTTLVRKIFLTCYQENYNLSQHVVQPPDALRRDTLFALQTVLPFNVRRPQRAVPVYLSGAQYTFGLEHISGLNATPVLPGVFVAGPHHYKGHPELIRFDASIVDEGSIPAFNTYLCWKAFNKSNVLLGSDLVGTAISPGQCIVFPFPNTSIFDIVGVDHVDIFLKFVLRNEDVVLQRYLIQVQNV
jgi:hypothetical protein